jgi:O-antigen/teichoic acid export membrane protein
MDPSPAVGTETRLGSEEVRDRAAGGAAVLGARGAIVFALGSGANIALARMLVPRDFGVVALGSVLLVVGTYLVDGGLGAVLIRRERPPERIELEAVEGLQLLIASGLGALGAAAAVTFGRDGLVIATMLVSLPIWSARIPAAIVLERRIQYRSIAFVDLLEAVTYYAWALVAVAIGFGVWGLASAVIARAVIGVIAMNRVGPIGFVRPRWSWRTVRPFVPFGVKLQATALVAMGRDQGLNVGVASIAGIATLGVWSLAYRILQVPTLIITTATRVSFPAMSRMLEVGEDPRRPVERAVGTLTVLMGIVVVGLVGCAPAAMPALLGDGWGDVPAILLWSGAGLLLSAPVIVSTIGYLYATDHAGTVVWATVCHTGVWFAVTFPLLPSLDAVAVGVGWVPAGIVMAAIVGRRTSRLTGASISRSLAPPAAVALAAGAAGWALALAGPETVPWGIAGALAAEAVLAAGLGLVRRSLLTDTFALAARAVRSSRGRAPSGQSGPIA